MNLFQMKGDVPGQKDRQIGKNSQDRTLQSAEVCGHQMKE